MLCQGEETIARHLTSGTPQAGAKLLDWKSNESPSPPRVVTLITRLSRSFVSAPMSTSSAAKSAGEICTRMSIRFRQTSSSCDASRLRPWQIKLTVSGSEATRSFPRSAGSRIEVTFFGSPSFGKSSSILSLVIGVAISSPLFDANVMAVPVETCPSDQRMCAAANVALHVQKN